MRDNNTAKPGGMALVLQGGGARTAYQAGVLRGLARLLDQHGWSAARNPFPIVSGTSSGAINAAFYACGCDHWSERIEQLWQLWAGLRVDQVIHASAPRLFGSGLRWLGLFSLGWLVRQRPRALLDPRPLARTLALQLAMDRLPQLIRQGQLRALALTASSYSSGQHIAFCQGDDSLQPWQRSRTRGVLQTLGVEHVLASTALPLLFPAVRLSLGEGEEYFGDGAMRQLSPLAPALHLGAACALAIGVGEPRFAAEPKAPSYPSIAQIGGHVLSTVFFDTLPADVQLAEHINAAVRAEAAQGPAMAPALREFPVLLLTPSQSIEALAHEHWQGLPPALRALFGAVGMNRNGGANLASYLLFDAAFAQSLLRLGEADAQRRADEILGFFERYLPAPGRPSASA